MTWTTWTPPYAPHVEGRYTELEIDPDTNQPLEQRVSAMCRQCGAEWGPVTCTSGMVRQHIATFARVHLHRDALREPFPTRKP